MSHFHADHVGGIFTLAGEVIFPNAMLHFPEVEWDYVQNTTGTPMDDQIGLALAKSAPYVAADQFATYAMDAEVLPGIFAMHTPGHTPGHIAMRLSSGDAQLVLTSDTATHPILALNDPDWAFAFDADPALASETRRTLFGMLADEQLPFLSYHFPFPGVGYVARQGDGFEYLPTEL
ncbi:MAG: MBL fold metallo-hydrolase [Chloroflexota bacterium]|nr:MBL fold metallo-hydrolase [Chloroflexota bacterium]